MEAACGEGRVYAAELRGKLPSEMEDMEDVLTSNVFSFFKYSRRKTFLRGYLRSLGFDVSQEEAEEAEFLFWPRFKDRTEPDLVLVAGRYYFLVEAKYFSGFGVETAKTEAQLVREIKEGEKEARRMGKEFVLIAITSAHYSEADKSVVVPSGCVQWVKWTQWQSVASFVERALESTRDISQGEREFAHDLYQLLDKKNLRGFRGFTALLDSGVRLRSHPSVFFDERTARFRGRFIGFMRSLSFAEEMALVGGSIFYGEEEEMFAPLLALGELERVGTRVFYGKEEQCRD